MDYQTFYGVYGEEAKVHNRFEGFGVPMQLLEALEQDEATLQFFSSLSPELQNQIAGYIRGAHTVQEQRERAVSAVANLRARNADVKSY